MSLVEKPHGVGKTVTQIHETEQRLVLALKRNADFLAPSAHDTILQVRDIAIVMGG